MHSLEANASSAGRFLTAIVVEIADCRISVASQDTVGAVYPQILT